MDKLLARYVLNDLRRVKRCSKLRLDMQLFGIENILTDIQANVNTAAYPIPNSVLKEIWPQYKEIWDKIPENLTTEEEHQYMMTYKRIVKNETIFNVLPKKNDNKDYSDEIQEELNAIQDEIVLYSENEKEFNFGDIEQYWDEDKETLTKTIPTPFKKMNDQLQGGWLPGRVYIFEAAPETKKTMLMLYIAVWLARLGYKVQYISTELIDLDARERVFSISRGMTDPECIGEMKWADASDESKEPVIKLIKEFGSNLAYKFYPTTTMRQIERYLEDKDYDLLIIDHPSEYRMRPNYPVKEDKKWDIEEKVYGDIFTFCRKTRKPVLLPSFVTKSGMESMKKTGGSEMWYGTGTVGKSAIVDAKYTLVCDPSVKDDKGREKQNITLHPVKLRRTGKKGMKKEPIYLEFNGDSALFYETMRNGDRSGLINPESKNWALKENKGA